MLVTFCIAFISYSIFFCKKQFFDYYYFFVYQKFYKLFNLRLKIYILTVTFTQKFINSIMLTTLTMLFTMLTFILITFLQKLFDYYIFYKQIKLHSEPISYNKPPFSYAQLIIQVTIISYSHSYLSFFFMFYLSYFMF